ncbi:putative m7GpppN-mRNA hydrolase [Apostichopus japonicus]|uniref:mRNA-decapping enzyme 2 n=1 Tax=Stichopus japonicus TaxID=307972 RepID=A0A2G8JDS9_STIJA|nr:putative m7GpppN-mRNA hydrolase [Apostichopus japonicus]
MASELITNRGRIPQQVLDSLCSRFILNIPTEESSDMIRAFFQIELAHWFYIDFYRIEHPGLPQLGIQVSLAFGLLFNHCPSLLDHAKEVDTIHAAWKEYKKNVPTYGAILIDDKMQYILMVQSFLSRTSWGFPKGKVNKDEKPHQCAIREVKEETGFDISQLLDANNFIELTINEGLSRLYVVPNVPMDTDFRPMTRGEIKDIRWFNLNDLPMHKKDTAPRVNLGLNPNNFFMTPEEKIASMRGPKNIKSRDSAFTPTILKNPARQGGNTENIQEMGSPLRQIQRKEVISESPTTIEQQKSRQQQMFKQGCKEEWDKYFCGIEDASGRIEADQSSPRNFKTNQKGRKIDFEIHLASNIMPPWVVLGMLLSPVLDEAVVCISTCCEKVKNPGHAFNMQCGMI